MIVTSFNYKKYNILVTIVYLVFLWKKTQFPFNAFMDYLLVSIFRFVLILSSISHTSVHVLGL